MNKCTVEYIHKVASPLEARLIRWALILSPIPVLAGLFTGLFGTIDPTLSLMLFANFVVLLITGPRWFEITWTVVLGVGITLILELLNLPRRSVIGSEFVFLGGNVGFAALIVLFVRGYRAKGVGRALAIDGLVTGWLNVVLWCCMCFTLPLTAVLSPVTLDPLFYEVDRGFGREVSFILGRILASRPQLGHVTAFLYEALPAGIGTALALALVRPRIPYRVLQLFLSIAFVGFLSYWIAPAAGPRHAFPDGYPWHEPDFGLGGIQPIALPNVPRNCMPSLHFACALAVYWTLKHVSPLARLSSWLFLVATAFATLALGEHYLIDLVVAVPFVVALQAVWITALDWRRRERWQAAVLCTGLVVLWLALLRCGWLAVPENRALVSGLSVFTVGISLWMESELCLGRRKCNPSLYGQLPLSSVGLGDTAVSANLDPAVR